MPVGGGFRVVGTGHNDHAQEQSGLVGPVGVAGTYEPVLGWDDPLWDVGDDCFGDVASAASADLVPVAARGHVTARLTEFADSTLVAQGKPSSFCSGRTHYIIGFGHLRVSAVTLLDEQVALYAHGPRTSPRFDVGYLGDGTITLPDLTACADRPVAMASAAMGDRTLVALTTHQPFASCEAPFGPATTVQIALFDAVGTVLAEDALVLDHEVDDLQIAADGDRAWLAARRVDDPSVTTARVGADASITHAFAIGASPEHAIAPWRDGIAVADHRADGSIRVRLVDGTGAVLDQLPAPAAVPQPAGRPALAVSADGTSIALASFDRVEPETFHDRASRVMVVRAEGDL